MPCWAVHAGATWQLPAHTGTQNRPALERGLPRAGKEFSDLTGFPADRLLADPNSESYAKLPFKQGALSTFFSPQVSARDLH